MIKRFIKLLLFVISLPFFCVAAFATPLFMIITPIVYVMKGQDRAMAFMMLPTMGLAGFCVSIADKIDAV